VSARNIGDRGRVKGRKGRGREDKIRQRNGREG